MNRLSNQKGFTLIELIVVIAILGILATIAVPRVVGIVELAKIVADQATVKTFNAVTPIFRNLTISSDPFIDDTKNNEELMGVLVSNGYLASAVEPQSKDAEFTWIIDKEQWYLEFSDSFYIITSADGLSFKSLSGWFANTLDGTYSGSSKDIVIPYELDGIVVEQIYQDVFNGKGLVAVSFGENSVITQIHARAFRYNNLTQIDLPDSLVRVDWGAFQDNDLTKITIGSNVNTIAAKAFGENTDEFKDAYEHGGAGTYLLNDAGEWIKQ